MRVPVALCALLVAGCDPVFDLRVAVEVESSLRSDLEAERLTVVEVPAGAPRASVRAFAGLTDTHCRGEGDAVVLQLRREAIP